MLFFSEKTYNTYLHFTPFLDTETSQVVKFTLKECEHQQPCFDLACPEFSDLSTRWVKYVTVNALHEEGANKNASTLTYLIIWGNHGMCIVTETNAMHDRIIHLS